MNYYKNLSPVGKYRMEVLVYSILFYAKKLELSYDAYEFLKGTYHWKWEKDRVQVRNCSDKYNEWVLIEYV